MQSYTSIHHHHDQQTNANNNVHHCSLSPSKGGAMRVRAISSIRAWIIGYWRTNLHIGALLSAGLDVYVRPEEQGSAVFLKEQCPLGELFLFPLTRIELEWAI